MPQDKTKPRSRFERRVRQAAFVVGFERFWPLFVGAACLVALFVALAWAGLWLVLPVWCRPLGTLALGAGLLAMARAAFRAGLPKRREALARLDRDSGERHRPVSTHADTLADADADPLTRAFWTLHRRKLEALAAGVKVALPSPRLVDRDRYALRAGVLLVLVATGLMAGPERMGRLAAAFDWSAGGGAPAGFRMDAWIDPPPYTGKPPLLLPLGQDKAAAAAARPIAVPVHSTVVVRAAGAGQAEVRAEGGLSPPPAAKDAPPQAKPQQAGADSRFVLNGDGRLVLGHDGSPLGAFDLHAIPDLPPTIALTDKPVRNARGSLTLKYKIDDDYGVIGAEANFANPVLRGKPVTGRALVAPPKIPLGLPAAPRGLGEAQTTADLSDHPWAGAEVSMTLSARDEGGNMGFAAPVTTTLPARVFTQPLARALVEQRRNLVLDPDHHDTVRVALDALALAPELFEPTPAIYLGLTAARKRLADARSDEDLLGVANLLWSMALQIEDGDLSQTERDLRALQQQLKDALARNAAPDEIKKLTEALRQKLDQLLAELAQKNAQADPQNSPRDPNVRTLTPKDLQSLLDRLDQSARNGDMAEAQNLLDQLQNILENLKTGQHRNAGDQSTRDLNRSMSELDKMMREQQSLRDKTFQQGSKGRKAARNRDDQQDGDDGQSPNSADSGNPGDDGDKAATDALGQQQGALRRQLDALQRRLKDLGMKGEQGFDDAEQAMKDAESALGKGPGNTDQAVEAQGRALQALRQGAEGMANQMAQGDQSGEGMGRDEGNGNQDGTDTDPLGRPRQNRDKGGHDVDMTEGFDAQGGLAARAAKVLEELRRRLGDPSRPQEEQDYLERLLRRY